MSILHTYITLDLETTGLNPKESEIIEIGAVKVKDGEIVDRFQTYVRPQMGVPEEITRLTGIAFKDVRNAPRINAAIENFTTFAGGLPLIVHQGRFETRFLSEASGLLLGYDIHSVRDLARVALPSLSDHRANTLADYFEVESQSAHKHFAMPSNSRAYTRASSRSCAKPHSAPNNKYSSFCKAQIAPCSTSLSIWAMKRPKANL